MASNRRRTIIDRKLFFFSDDFNVIYNYNDIHKDINTTFIDSYAKYYLFNESDWNQERIFRFCKTETSSCHQLRPMFRINSFRGFKLHFNKYQNPGNIDEKTVMDKMQQLKEEFFIETTTIQIIDTSFNSTETDPKSSSVKSNLKKNILGIIGIVVAILLILSAISILYIFMGRKRKVKKLVQEKECEKNEKRNEKNEQIQTS